MNKFYDKQTLGNTAGISTISAHSTVHYKKTICRLQCKNAETMPFCVDS